MAVMNEPKGDSRETDGQPSGHVRGGVSGRVILVTGAASGLGFADSKMLVEQGALEECSRRPGAAFVSPSPFCGLGGGDPWPSGFSLASSGG